LDEVQAVFRRVFEKPSIMVGLSTTAGEIPGWDSLTHMRLIAALENHFKIVFTFDEVSAFKNVGDMLQLIEKKTNK
jgi:acyl carrier protein